MEEKEIRSRIIIDAFGRIMLSSEPLSEEEKTKRFNEAIRHAMRCLYVLRTDRNIPWPKNPWEDTFDFDKYVEDKYASLAA